MDNECTANPELISMLKMLAEDGDFKSQKVLAHMYFEGENLTKNMEQSLFGLMLLCLTRNAARKKC